MEGIQNYDQLRSEAQDFYRTIKPIPCPAFNSELIHFNAEGFNHIIFKNARTERERSSQILRFKLLHLAAKLIKITTTYQEFEETSKEFTVKSFKKRARKIQPVRYYGLIAIIDSRKIKVIIRKIGDQGLMHFWSIVPAWTTNKYRDTKFFTTMKGDPDED